MSWYIDKIRGRVGISGLEENGYNPAPNCKNRDCRNESRDQQSPQRDQDKSALQMWHPIILFGLFTKH